MRDGLLRFVLAAGLGLLLAGCNITPINLPKEDGGSPSKDGGKGWGFEAGTSQGDSYLPTDSDHGLAKKDGGTGWGDGTDRDGLTEAGKTGDGTALDAMGGESPPSKETGPVSKDGFGPGIEGGTPKWDL